MPKIKTLKPTRYDTKKEEDEQRKRWLTKDKLAEIPTLPSFKLPRAKHNLRA